MKNVGIAILKAVLILALLAVAGLGVYSVFMGGVFGGFFLATLVNWLFYFIGTFTLLLFVIFFYGIMESI